MASDKKDGPVPVETLPSGAQRVAPGDLLRSEKGQRLIREMLDSDLYRSIVRANHERNQVAKRPARELEDQLQRIRDVEHPADGSVALEALKQLLAAQEELVRAREAVVRVREEIVRVAGARSSER